VKVRKEGRLAKDRETSNVEEIISIRDAAGISRFLSAGSTKQCVSNAQVLEN
jgi:hypothetical protein